MRRLRLSQRERGLANPRFNRSQCGDDVCEKASEVVIVFVEREPRNRAMAGRNPIAYERRLAKSSRRGNERERVRHRLIESRKQSARRTSCGRGGI